MKFQRSTIILLFGALLMGGAFYYYQTLFIPAQEAKEAFARKLFKFKQEDVQAVFVKTQSQTLRFERASELSTPQDLWLMQILEVAEVKEEKPSPKATPKATANPEEISGATPAETTEEIPGETPAETTEEIPGETPAETTEETVKSEENAAKENSNSADKITGNSTQISQEKVYANEAYVSFLLEQLVSDRSQQTLTATPEQIKEYGLNPPVAIIEVILKDQKIYQMILGKSEFSGNAIYAQINPPLPETENQTVLVVSKNFQYAVDRTLEEWKQPAAVLDDNSAEPSGSGSELNTENPSENLPASNETENPAPENNPEPETLEPTPESSAPNPETTEPVNPESIP
jgi:hypothetical protein